MLTLPLAGKKKSSINASAVIALAAAEARRMAVLFLIVGFMAMFPLRCPASR